MLKYLFVLVVALMQTASLSAEELKLTLQQAEEIALESNKALNVQEYLTKQGKYRYRAAWSRWLPGASLDASMLRTAQGGSLGYATVTSSTVGFSQTVYSSDAYHGVKRTKVEEKQLKNDLSDLKNTILLDVRVTYYAVVVANNQIEVERENIALLQEAFELQQERLDVGESTSFDVHQSQVSVANAWSAYHRAVRDAQIGRNDLLLLLGMDPLYDIVLAEEVPLHCVSDLAEKLDQLKKGEISPGDPIYSDAEMWRWESETLIHRPEIQRQKYAADLADRGVKERYGEYLPDVNLFANYTNRSSGLATFLTRNSYWDMGMGVSWSLFDGMGRENRICDAKMGRRAAQKGYEKSIQDAKADVRNRFSSSKIYCQQGDIVSKLGKYYRGVNVFNILPKKPSIASSAHNKIYSGQKEVVVLKVSKKKNHCSLGRKLFTIIHQCVAIPIFIMLATLLAIKAAIYTVSQVVRRLVKGAGSCDSRDSRLGKRPVPALGILGVTQKKP